MNELAKIFRNIFVLSDCRGHFTLKCHIFWRNEVSESERGTRFCRIKESLIMELNPSQAIMCRMVD